MKRPPFTLAIEDDASSSRSEYYAGAVRAYCHCAPVDGPCPAANPNYGKPFPPENREDPMGYVAYFRHNATAPSFTTTGGRFTRQ